MQVEPFQTELVIFPDISQLSDLAILSNTMGLSNGPRQKLNDPIWSRSPDPLLVPQSPFWVWQVLLAKIGISVFRLTPQKVGPGAS
jgi:hypothetical protein